MAATAGLTFARRSVAAVVGGGAQARRHPGRQL